MAVDIVVDKTMFFFKLLQRLVVDIWFSLICSITMGNRFKLWVIILSGIGLPAISLGQLNPRFFASNGSPLPTQISEGTPSYPHRSFYQQWIPVFNALSYCRNNEFEHPIYPGHTYFGYQLHPEWMWEKNTHGYPLLRLGVFIQHEFGEAYPRIVRPTFTLTYATKATRFLFGTLQGALQHQLIEPLYGFENTFRTFIEEGFQVIHQQPGLELDAWIQWKQTTYPGLDRQEILASGLRADGRLWHQPGLGKWLLQLQATNLHKGGAGVSELMVNKSNVALGSSLWIGDSGGWFLKGMPYAMYAINHSHNPSEPFTRGWATYLNAEMGYQHFSCMWSYFRGTQFFSSYGGDMYMSYTMTPSPYVQRERRLMLLRILYEKELTAIPFSYALRLEPMWDRSGAFDYSFGIYVKTGLGNRQKTTQ
jgi:hypothetical protein